MNIATLMGTSGIQGELAGQSKQAAAGADGEFKQALQVLMAGIDEQQLPDGIAINGDQKENWLGALLKLFDQGSTPQAMPDTAEKTAQVAPEAANFSLTEIMRTFQTLINQNDAEMLLDGGVAGDQSTAGAATEETDASEIDPASLASQSQVISPVSITTRQTRPDLSPTSIKSPVINPLTATSSTTASNGTVPTTTHPEAVFVEEAAANQAKSQANGTAQANHGSGVNGAKATTGGAASQSAMPATGNQNTNAMPQPSTTPATSSFSATPTTTPLSTTPTADTQTVAQGAAAQTPAAEALTNAAKQSEAMAEAMKATSSPEPAPTAKGSSGDTAEAASPFPSATVSHTSADVAPARVAGSAAPSLPDVPVSSQIMDSIKLIMQQDETQVRMQLHPKELGQVLVQLHINEGRVSVNMLAENSHAQSLIQSQLPQLKEALAAQGLQIHEANINVGSDTSAFDTPQQRSRDANFSGNRYQQGNQAMFDEGAPVSTHGSSRTPGSLYAIDYQV